MNLRDPKTAKIIARVVLAIYDDLQTIKRELRIMSDQTDALAAAVADLQQKNADQALAAADHDVAVQAELQALQTAINGSAAKDDPVVARAIANISDASASVAKVTQGIRDESAALAASVLPPAPAPAPVPQPIPDNPATT